ncbi:hypothetical protein BV20DRAFT_173196 [Pilatotrama ljubarskyi]|nr:hypothetical protein BV20DRAFT_173196 [Pilatotrama ljubarskyi]
MLKACPDINCGSRRPLDNSLSPPHSLTPSSALPIHSIAPSANSSEYLRSFLWTRRPRCVKTETYDHSNAGNMTSRPLHCSGCYEESSDLKCCAACKKAWYCSKECQTRSWRRHIFDCKRKKPIGTAYYLSRACYDDLIPVHAQTRKDFGFDKAKKLFGGLGESNLLGLWIGVLKIHEVPEREVQRWQAEGKLIEGVKATFERDSPFTKGEYYPWFLEHQYLLDGSPADEGLVSEIRESSVKDAILRAWMFTGGSRNDSWQTIQAALAAMPEEKQKCHPLYRQALTSSHPPPKVDEWVTFGFVSAMHQYTELQIGRLYHELIHHCTFEDFCAAYETSALPRLAEERGMFKPDRGHNSFIDGRALIFFRDVMSESPRRYKSVWYLKQYVDVLVCADAAEPPRYTHKAIVADYGFMNCKKGSERKLLEELYTKYFAHRDANPLELHEACVAGGLAEYLVRFVKLSLWTATYKRLLKNPYPLPALGDWQGRAASARSVIVVR